MYLITIAKIEDKEVTKREYQNTGKKDEKGEAIYGYVTSEVVEPVSREIYSQSVEAITLEKIIKAINFLD